MRTSFFVLIIFSISCFLSSCSEKQADIQVTSPDGRLIGHFALADSGPQYWLTYDGENILDRSSLGIRFKELEFLDSLEILSIDHQDIDEPWEQPWGEDRWIENKYQELVVSFKPRHLLRLKLIFRAYDDGLAFRYRLSADRKVEHAIIVDELTEFNIAREGEAWWIEAYNPNRYEQLYQHGSLSEFDTAHTPLTLRLDNGLHVSIHEADLEYYSSMQLFNNPVSGNLECDLAPWSNGDKVRINLPFETPWRTIKVSEDAVGLVNSHLTLNCNDPSLIDDESWISHGKYIGIWWGMIIGKWTWSEGFRHGATTERAIKYIDFAADNGFDEVLVEGWSADFESLFPGDTVKTNFTVSSSDFDLDYVQSYAQSRGLSLQAYHETSANTGNYLAQIDSAFAQLSDLGIKNVKIGHVGALLNHSEYHYGQLGVQYYRTVLQKAAEYKLGVNFHEPIKDTGERRKYPNMLTREGARGMEYNAWGFGGNPVDHASTLAYTRLLESPMDFTPGIFDLLYDNVDPDNDPVPVTFKLIDKGNGYTNVRYRGAESFWRSKPMQRNVEVLNGDTTFIWTCTENMKPGIWEWGIAAHDIKEDNNQVWLPNVIEQGNQKVEIADDMILSGNFELTIPNQGVNPSQRNTASNEDLDIRDGNVFGVTQRVNTTLAKQLAYYVVIYSPLQMAADFIENYEGNEAFQFIKDVPVDWESSVALNGEIGEYVTMLRKDRNSGDWFLGCINNEIPRTLEIDLDFLKFGDYVAEYYRDAADSDWESNPLAIEIGEEELADTYKFYVASGGGHAVRFRYLGEDLK